MSNGLSAANGEVSRAIDSAGRGGREMAGLGNGDMIESLDPVDMMGLMISSPIMLSDGSRNNDLIVDQIINVIRTQDPGVHLIEHKINHDPLGQIGSSYLTN